MIKALIKVLLFLIPVLPVSGRAQQLLTLENAIDTALQKNFDIRIARNNLEIAEKNNTFGNAGGLPSVTASAGDNGSATTSKQQFSDNTTQTITGNTANSMNAGISGEIVLFNGFRVVAAKERLNRLQEQSRILLNQQVQSIIADVMTTYYDVVRQQSYLKIIGSSLDVSRQKLEIIQIKDKVGMADAVDLLQAETDLNSAQQQYSIQQLAIEQGKSDLLLLIGSKMFPEFSVIDSIVVDKTLELDSILNLIDRNPQFRSAEQQILIDQQLLKEVSAQRYPTVKLNAGYDFYRSESNKGNLLLNEYYGPSAGISLQIPVFNGMINKTRQEVVRINLENSKLEKESLALSLNTQAVKLFNAYQTTLRQIGSQQQNVEMSRKLLQVVMQQFNLNQATILDVKAAQASYENAAYLLTNLIYSAKVAETGLKQLTYSLVF